MLSQAVLPLVEAKERSRTDFQGAGDVEDIHRAAAQSGRFGAQVKKPLHEGVAVDFREKIEPALEAALKQSDLRIRLVSGDFVPKNLQAQGIDQFRLLDFPDGQRLFL
ncbi:MAG: hypothetical protein ACO3JG_13510 [Luteolibacter sp.]